MTDEVAYTKVIETPPITIDLEGMVRWYSRRQSAWDQTTAALLMELLELRRQSHQPASGAVGYLIWHKTADHRSGTTYAHIPNWAKAPWQGHEDWVVKPLFYVEEEITP